MNERALAAVEAAFAEVPRPRNEELLHPDCADAMDIVPLYAFASWRDLQDADVIGTYAASSFLSAAGFRFFLPAYLRFALRNPNRGEACVSTTIWHLDPALYDEAMRTSDYAEDAEHALAAWR